MSVAQTFSVTCPNCGRRLSCPPQLAGKRAKCQCGQSILCPTTPGLPAQAAGPTSAPATLGYRTAPTPADQAAAANGEHAALIRQAVLYSLILALILGAVFGLRYLGGSRGGKVAAKPSLGDDAKVEEMIADEDGTEARQWLADRPGRILSGMTTSQAQRRIDDWYNMGATRVYAFGGALTMNVALELPPDPAKRKALFDWTNDWNAKSLVPPAPDVGQKYLLVHLRL